jgi:regulator of CtrA degradation
MSEAIGGAASRWRTSGVQDFASSELFDRTFQEGMELVEETAAYLDGAGRQDSKLLSRAAALAYAGESMRLTTRLMQVASWLLVQRAVREGDMNPSEACQDRYRLAEPVEEIRQQQSTPADELPSGLLQLLDRSARLYERVLHLDRRMYKEEPIGEAEHPVLSQIEKLNAAFGKK